ncbi:MAG: WhiB family transcriptional regulator [Actinomycetota bacterium]|nr:WhiB family transcriptional regulator [Actinomycetota bacterium]
MSWYARAACRGRPVSIFFTSVGVDQSPAKAICARCPVQERCLEDALARREPYGVWGGLSLQERRVLLRSRRRVA